MDKFLIVFKSGNRKTGPILITTSPRATCPFACPLRKGSASEQAGVCYAEHGHLGHWLWARLDRTPVGGSFGNNIRVWSFEDLLGVIRNLPPDTMWRHNQAGDFPSEDRVTICRERVRRLMAANDGRRGFTYTHFDVIDNEANRATIKEANDNGFTVNLSADSIEEADQLADLEIAPVTTVVPATQMTNMATPKGQKVVICPAIVNDNVSCATQRKAIIAFPVHGPFAHKVVA